MAIQVQAIFRKVGDITKKNIGIDQVDSGNIKIRKYLFDQDQADTDYFILGINNPILSSKMTSELYKKEVDNFQLYYSSYASHLKEQRFYVVRNTTDTASTAINYYLRYEPEDTYNNIPAQIYSGSAEFSSVDTADDKITINTSIDFTDIMFVINLTNNTKAYISDLNITSSTIELSFKNYSDNSVFTECKTLGLELISFSES